MRSIPFIISVVCGLSAVGIGCSKKANPHADRSGARTTYTPLGPAIKSDKPAQAQTGSITGRVVFTGPKPTPAKVAARPDPGCPDRAETSQDVVINPNGTLRDVLVRIAPGSVAAAAPPGSPVVLSQKGCAYSPRVAGALVGAVVQIHNADQTAHDVRIVRGDDVLVTDTIKPGGSDLSETDLTEQVGLLKIESKTRPGMLAFVATSDNPFFQTTGEDGTFKLDGLAPGKYTVEAWHPKYGTRSASLPVEPGKATDVAFGFDDTLAP